MSNIKKETISGTKWLLLQKCTLQPITFIYSMVLARLISPEEMGIIGLTTVFFAVASTLASAGFGTALIRKPDRTSIDCDTTFWFNFVMNAIMGIILYSASPWFASFYHQPELLWLTRCSALLMVISSTAGVHTTLFIARRDFKTLAILQTISAIMVMPVCIILAYKGWGVWALMTSNILSTSLSLILVWFFSPWKPRFRFSWASFRALFSFGCNLTGAALIDTIYSHLRTFIIGKFYTPADLGMYSKGERLATIAPHTINGILTSVTFPILATIQNSPERLGALCKKYIKLLSLPIFVSNIILIALAEPFIVVCFGELWRPCAIFLQLVAAGVMFDHINSINVCLLKVIGKSNLLLRMEFIKKGIYTLSILCASSISVTAICAVTIINAQIALYINSHYIGKIFGYTWSKQMKDYWPYVFMATIASTPSIILQIINLPDFVILITGGLSSLFIYLVILISRNDESLREYVSLFEKRLPALLSKKIKIMLK